jgi:hypothetical protein
MLNWYQVGPLNYDRPAGGRAVRAMGAGRYEAAVGTLWRSCGIRGPVPATSAR